MGTMRSPVKTSFLNLQLTFLAKYEETFNPSLLKCVEAALRRLPHYVSVLFQYFLSQI